MNIGWSKSTLFPMCAIASALLLAGCPWDSPDKHLQRGKEFAAKNNHAEAVIELKNFLQTNPKSVEARFLLGQELLVQGNVKAAEIELQKVYDSRYQRDSVVPLLAESQLLQGEFDKVAAHVQNGELGSPIANARLETTFGSALLLQGKLEDAKAAFNKAQEYVSGFPVAVIGAARIKAAHGDLDGASSDLAPILAKEPGQVEGLILKGDIAKARGQMDVAISSYRDAAAKSPRNLIARVNLVAAYIATRSFDLAQKQVTELKRAAPGNPEVNYQDALLAFNAGDYARASESIRTTLSGAPANGTAEILYGAILLGSRQPEQAELHLKEGLRRVPQSLFARTSLTRLYLGRRETEKAAEVLRPAFAAFPNEPAFLTLAGEIALQQGNFGEASKLLSKAGEIEPGNSKVRMEAAGAEFAKGDERRGFEALEATAKASSNEALPVVALVLARLQRRQFDKAAEAWKALESEHPKDPMTYTLRAAIDIGLNDPVAARKALERALVIEPTHLSAVVNLAAMDEEAGDVPAARNRFQTLVDKDKSNPQALLAFAQFEIRHGAKTETVVSLLEAARRADPTSTKAVTALVAYYISQKLPKQALAAIQDGLVRSPQDPKLLSIAGALHLGGISVDQALATYRQLVAAYPNVVGYQIGLGMAMLAANQVDSAVQIFSSSLKSHPNAYVAQAVAVDSLLDAKRYADAARLLAQIRKATPQSPMIRELEGDSKYAVKQFAEAAAAYRTVTAQESRVTMKLYAALQQSGDQQGANVVLSDWLKSHPHDAALHSFDGDMALRMKDYSRAANSYRRVLESRPDDPAVLNNLAIALLELKDDQALTVARKANALAPGNPAISDTLGWVLVERGETRQGLPLLQQAAAGAPKENSIALHLAKAQLKEGRKEEARTILQTLLKNAPESLEGKESKVLIASLNGVSPERGPLK